VGRSLYGSVSNKTFIFFKLLTFGAAATPKLASAKRSGYLFFFSHTLHHIGGMLFIYIKDFFAFILVIRPGNFGFTVLDMNLSPTQ
jgi:hypothetical protein